MLRLLATLALLTGCVDTPREMTLASRLDPIRGGQVDANSTAVVGVLFQQNGQQGICSGSLIAPNLVLTAQHCVAQIRSPQVICGQSQFGDLHPPSAFFVTTDTQMQNGGRFYRVREVQVPQLYADNCGYDIAVLVLDQPIGANEATPLIPRIDSYPQAGERFSAVGYGHVGNFTGEGTRRIITNRQILCAGPSCAGNQGITTTELVGDDGTCQGDSGGPAIDAQGRVLGALSRGGEGCVYPVYAAVAGWGEWLKGQARDAAALGGYRAPDWADPPAPEPEVADLDADGLPDDVDNCPEQANPGQGDLDVDGIGDLCDPRLDRECSVCRACQAHADCGPGAYCDGNGLCFMECRTDADCPGGDTTTCQRYEGFSVCVNADVAQGLCPQGYACGEVAAPRAEPPSAPPAERPEEEPPPAVPPVDEGAPGMGSPEAPPPVFVAPSVGRASYTGGCAAAPEGGAGGWLLLGLLGLRRRRR